MATLSNNPFYFIFIIPVHNNWSNLTIFAIPATTNICFKLRDVEDRMKVAIHFW